MARTKENMKQRKRPTWPVKRPYLCGLLLLLTQNNGGFLTKADDSTPSNASPRWWDALRNESGALEETLTDRSRLRGDLTSINFYGNSVPSAAPGHPAAPVTTEESASEHAKKFRNSPFSITQRDVYVAVVTMASVGLLALLLRGIRAPMKAIGSMTKLESVKGKALDRTAELDVTKEPAWDTGRAEPEAAPDKSAEKGPSAPPAVKETTDPKAAATDVAEGVTAEEPTAFPAPLIVDELKARLHRGMELVPVAARLVGAVDTDEIKGLFQTMWKYLLEANNAREEIDEARSEGQSADEPDAVVEVEKERLMVINDALRNATEALRRMYEVAKERAHAVSQEATPIAPIAPLPEAELYLLWNMEGYKYLSALKKFFHSLVESSKEHSRRASRAYEDLNKEKKQEELTKDILNSACGYIERINAARTARDHAAAVAARLESTIVLGFKASLSGVVEDDWRRLWSTLKNHEVLLNLIKKSALVTGERLEWVVSPLESDVIEGHALSAEHVQARQTLRNSHTFAAMLEANDKIKATEDQLKTVVQRFQQHIQAGRGISGLLSEGTDELRAMQIATTTETVSRAKLYAKLTRRTLQRVERGVAQIFGGPLEQKGGIVFVNTAVVQHVLGNLRMAERQAAEGAAMSQKFAEEVRTGPDLNAINEAHTKADQVATGTSKAATIAAFTFVQYDLLAVLEHDMHASLATWNSASTRFFGNPGANSEDVKQLKERYIQARLAAKQAPDLPAIAAAAAAMKKCANKLEKLTLLNEDSALLRQ